MRKTVKLNPVSSRKKARGGKTRSAGYPLTTIDLFCGAGGITEGFREAGYRCLYGNDSMPEAIETFSLTTRKPGVMRVALKISSPRKCGRGLA